MKTALILNTLLKSQKWLEHISSLDPVKELLKKVNRLVKSSDIFLVVDDNGLKEVRGRFKGCKIIRVDDWKLSAVFREIHEVCRTYEDAIYLYIDAPLIDVEITQRMLDLHQQEYAEYTYGEGFPEGVLPEILKVSLFPKLISLLKDDLSKIERNSIFSTLSKEINSFDIETYFSPQDLRLKRIKLFTSIKRNALLVERIVQKKGFGCSFEEFCKLIQKNPSLLRTVPSYVEAEITNETSGRCIYLPISYLKREKGRMDYENFKTAFDKIKRFAEDFYIAFSLLGEPLIHSGIKKFIEYVIADDDVNLILETDGAMFTPDFSDYIQELQASNLHIIFEVDAVRDETYRKIRDGRLDQVERYIRYLLSKTTQNIYVQMVRMDVNEHEMLEFFDIWEKEGAKVIIQKYNSYLNLLPSLSQSDLQPLERMCCWHLLRDMVIFCNGDVPRCKQDINGAFHLGNILQEEVSDIWKKGEIFYLKHCANDYDDYCRICDEYFTFNF